MRPRLVTIPISHYGERARWALDLAGIDYDETHHLQMFSWVAAFWLGGKKTLPVLVHDGGALTDSADIVRFAAARGASTLYPQDEAARREIEAFEKPIADELGVETRRVAYDWFFRSLEVCLPFNAGNAPAAQAWTMWRLRGFVRAVAKRYLAVEAGHLAKGYAIIDATFDRVAERLSDGRPYLFGDRFTAADLTFAAMAAPAVLPENYGVKLPPLELLPPDAVDRIRSARSHPAGAYALKLYTGRPVPFKDRGGAR